MNLLSLGDFKPSSESEDAINDINSFLSDLKSNQKNNNNQINIQKVELNKISSAPIAIQKVTNSPIQEKKEGVSIKDCIRKGSSFPSNQKSNCEFSDSDIEFSDFMFSDDDDKKEKDTPNNKNNTNKNTNSKPIEPKIPEKTVQITNNFNIKPEKIEDNSNKNNLDEICLEDDDLNSGNGVFELSDISLSDKKEEVDDKPFKKEEPKNNINLQESINNKNPSTDNIISQNKNTSINIVNNKVNDSFSKINIEPIAKKEQISLNTDININKKVNDDIQNKESNKENDENKLFDINKIETEKTQPKKVIKKRKKPAHRNEIRSPLNILDDLQLSFDDKKTESNSNQMNQSDLQNNIFNYSPTVEKIKIEKVEKGKQPNLEQSTLPPLHTRSNETYTRTGLENFEYSFVSNLNYYLSEFRSTFITQFQNQVHKCFDYDTLVKNFLLNFTRELNDIIANSSNLQDYVPASFSDVESDLKSEFNQFSSLFSNSDKTEKDQFLLDEQFYPIDQVESIHSKLSNDCQFLLSQISKESQFLNQTFRDDNNQFNLNSKLIEISELESKLIQIDMERDFVGYRIKYIKDKTAEIQEKVDFLNKFNNNESNQSEFDEILDKLKELNKKNIDCKFNNNDHKSTIKEICDFCSLISSQFISMPNYSKEKTFLPNNSGYVNNLSMSSASFQYPSFDAFSLSQNGIVEDVKNRLLRARKVREETIADLRNYGPKYNFSISGF